MESQKDPVLIVGDERTAFSAAVCLLQTLSPVILFTGRKDEALQTIATHLADIHREKTDVFDRYDFKIIDRLPDALDARLAIALTPEDLALKQTTVKGLERILPADTTIAINAESIPLSSIQKNSVNAGRIIGANWVEPVHTTFFLELIANDVTDMALVDDVYSTAKFFWNKDPYILRHDRGIRSRMMSAMVREAFHLLENGFVTVEDIDRACRNDPGYYLPFAGHCRYMDLMGTYIYGLVMQDLNPELSKDRDFPSSFKEILRDGGEGMKNNKGFYVYEEGEVEKLNDEFRKFSYEIRNIISKYPFNYLRDVSALERKKVSNL